MLGKAVTIFNTEVREEERVTVEQRPREDQRLKPCGYLKVKHLGRKNSK